MCDLAEKLQNKIRMQKKQLEDTVRGFGNFLNKNSFFQEEQANLSLQKYRQIQISLDNAEERAQTAESSLARMRSRSRLNTPGLGSPLAKSETFA